MQNNISGGDGGFGGGGAGRFGGGGAGGYSGGKGITTKQKLLKLESSLI